MNGLPVYRHELERELDRCRWEFAGMKEKAMEILAKQDSLMAIFNTPANNPSGYSMTDEDVESVIAAVKKVIAYYRR